jgi:hypothetical protein
MSNPPSACFARRTEVACDVPPLMVSGTGRTSYDTPRMNDHLDRSAQDVPDSLAA